jgi:hypothetical protein
MRDAPLWNPEEDRWEMRYFGYGPALKDYGVSCTCLAVSRDGLKWEKPTVGRFEFRGSKQNNLAHPLGRPDTFLYHVQYDPRDPDPQRRWKALIGERNPRPAASPNGFDWTFLSDKRITSGEEQFLIYDKLSQRFLFLLRVKHEDRRAVSLSTSKDFVDWSEPRLLFCADERDQEVGKRWLERHLADPAMRKPLVNNPAQYNTQIYNMAVFPYEGLYIGLPTLFRHCGHSNDAPAGDGFSETGLTVSRDLVDWRYVDADRKTFLPLSPVGEGVYDTAQIEPPSRPLRIEDELWFYYTALKYRYSPGRSVHELDSGAINLAKLRLDGFVSLTAGAQEGMVLTRPLVWHGSTLWVNADARGGQLRVEVLGADGDPQDKALAAGQVTPASADGVRLPIRFRGASNPEDWEGKAVRLRFHLRNAHLFAFWTGR